MLSKGVAGYFPGRYGVLGLNFQHRTSGSKERGYNYQRCKATLAWLTWALSRSPYTVKMLVSGCTMTAWDGICARLQAWNWLTSARAPLGHSSS